MKIKYVLGLALPMLVMSCKKDKEETDVSMFEQTAKDQAIMETEMANVFKISHELLLLPSYEDLSQDGPAYDGSLPSCAGLSYNSSTKILTVNYGTSMCEGKDGIVRNGKFVIRIGEDYREKNGYVTIDLLAYNVQNITYSGQIRITNMTGSGAVSVRYQVLNASARTTSGTITWNADYTISKTGGGGTPTVFDDIYTVSGGANGTNRRGVGFTATIKTPLKKKIKLGCATTYVLGLIDFKDDDGNFVKLDYDPFDNEACDKIASVKVNNQVWREFQVR